MERAIVFIGWSVRFFLLSGTLKSNGVILSDVVQRLGSTNSIVGWAFSLQQGVCYTISPFATILLRSFTRRQLAVSVSFLVGLSYVYFGLCANSVTEIFLIYIVSGVGFGCNMVGGYFSFVEHFHDNLPTMISSTSLFQFFGLAVLPLVLQYFKSSFGLSQGLILFGALLLNLVSSAFAVTISVRKCQQGKTSNATETQQASLCPYMETPVKKQATGMESEKGLFRSLSTLFRHDNAAIIISLEGIVHYVFVSWGLFLVSVGTCAGLNTDQAVLLSTAAGIGGFFGKLLAVGLFHVEKMDAYTSSMIPMICNSISLLACSLVTQLYTMVILTCASGVCIGLSTSGLFGLLPTVVCRYHYQYAFVTLSVVDGALIQLGGLISGIISDFMGCASYVFLFNSFLSIAGLPLVIRWACRKHPEKETVA